MRELESRPESWNNGRLLPAAPEDYNTGWPVDRFKGDVFGVWARHLDFLSHAGSIRWQYAPMDLERRGVSIAFVPVVLPEDVRRYGEGRTMVLMRTGTGFTPTSDLPDEAEAPILLFTDDEWDAFVLGAKDREFDLGGSLEGLPLRRALAATAMIDGEVVSAAQANAQAWGDA